MTMKWWDDLWLNEGFATYMTYIVLGHLEPDWEVGFLAINMLFFPNMLSFDSVFRC